MDSTDSAGAGKRLLLVDGSALLYRSHFAFIRNPLRNAKGEPTSVPYGVLQTLLPLLESKRPDKVAVVFDTAAPTFRHKLYADYKDKGLVIVGVSIDDSPEQLQSFMKEFRMNYPVLQMKPEVEDFWGPFYGYPTTFLIARDGSICTKHLGPVSKEDGEREIKALLDVPL